MSAVGVGLIAVAAVAGACGADADARRTTPSATLPVAPARLPGRVVARVDFEQANVEATGLVNGIQRVSDDRIRTVGRPVAEGRRSGKFTVRQGDNPIDSNDRAELQFTAGEYEGTERWYRWHTRFANGFPRDAYWQLVAQFHSYAPGVPPIALYAENGLLRLKVLSPDARRPQYLYEIPIETARWYTFTLRVKWSDDPSKGLIEAWVDNRKMGSRRMATLLPGKPNYFKIGYYRSSDIPGTGVVFHDGLVITQVSPK